MVMETLTRSALATLFQPQSVAVVGASSDPTKLGGRILQHLIYNGFEGKIYPINPKAPEIFGIPCLKSTADLPDGVDVAILALPSDISVEAARQCAERGVKVAINVAAGFAEEASEVSLLRHETMKQITRELGMRVVGPNTNGVYNATDHISLGFNTAHGEHIQPGGLAIVSHSGALFSTMMGRTQPVSAKIR